MKLRVVLYCFCLFVLASCGSSKKITKKKNQGVILNEPNPRKLPSVNQKEITRKLVKKNPRLNKHTIAYIIKYAPIAVKEMHDYKIPASITLAQGILESGNGKSGLAVKSNNHFGIKCHTGWKGQRVYYDDDAKGECFRKYKYVETSYNDHSAFLSKRLRYRFLFDYNINNYKKWARGLKKAGYATDRKYPNKLIKIIEDYHLSEFDKIKKRNLKKNKKAIKNQKTTSASVTSIIKKPSLKTHVVKKGETLYSISRKYKTTVQKLKKDNNLFNNTISIGLQLRIF